MDAILERAHQLKQDLIDFVMDAEGDIAQALESYAAIQARRGSGDNVQRDMIIDGFITEGKVGDKAPLDIFLQDNELPQADIDLLRKWRRSFIGLFTISEIFPDGFELTNWLTEKRYIVKPDNPRMLQDLSRCKVGEILLSRISPVTDTYWSFSGPCTVMGKLGKPKLAVAIGNFKDNHRNHLYSDAPDLLEEAWLSVEKYHSLFVDFFGSDEVTMPGYQLNKKMTEFQEILTQKQLEQAGVDTSKSLTEMAQSAGVDEEEIKAAATELGADSDVVSKLFDAKSTTGKMVAPKVELPAELKKAEQVTAISDPRWGQMLLPTYAKMKSILTADDWQSIEGAEKLVRFYLEDKTINALIWRRLAKEYPAQLEKVLQAILQRPEFKLERDLDSLIESNHKLLEPELPEIASVPLHLHNLFQEAMTEVNKSKPKGKNQKPVAKKGFSM
ncbi:MAG: hypothetical protein IGS39_22665 [Calothrix sp. C42_A2020_038]|nr:hypothetical protein [Calothrix sp. C42_A2020_038]